MKISVEETEASSGAFVKISTQKSDVSSESKATDLHTANHSETENDGYNSGMFSNIGSKIKGLAVFITCMGIISSVIGGIVLMVTDEELILPGILVMAVGSILSWVASFLLYGFGQLVDNSDKTVALLKEQNKKLNDK